jgi:hypothetical protein
VVCVGNKQFIPRVHWLAALILGATLISDAKAEALYAASLRDLRSGRTEGMGGALYSVDPTTGKSALVAPLRVGGLIPVGLVGLAIHPKTGVFYGLTAGIAPEIPRSLVTIDPTTGNATLVGSLGHVGSDIRFDEKGTLYAWLDEESRIGTVDLGTGAATPIGNSGYSETLGGGLVIDRAGDIYLSATGAAGTLDRLDVKTGQATVGPRLFGAPYIASVNSMAFSASGTLYAVNSNLGSPAKTSLIVIDKSSGYVKSIGALPNDIDALAFAPSNVASGAATNSSQSIQQWVLVAIALVAGMILGYAIRMAQRPLRRPSSLR